MMEMLKIIAVVYSITLHLNLCSETCFLQKDLVIYEMNVRAFTADESSGLDSDIRGSYLGVIEKVKTEANCCFVVQI